MNIDNLIISFDNGLRTVFAKANTVRPLPSADVPEADLGATEKAHAAALMRINHVGEVCAQALYNGQAITCKTPHIVEALKEAGHEETEHLAWCESRIEELGGRKSLLNPLWYIASFALGAFAGKIGDKWNLGFLAETERQVGQHLQGHLGKIAPQDAKTRAIITQMYTDEVKHASEANSLGAAELPPPVKAAMRLASKVMTRTAYYF